MLLIGTAAVIGIPGKEQTFELRLKIEVTTWIKHSRHTNRLDRDLGIAGVVNTRSNGKESHHLVLIDRPLVSFHYSNLGKVKCTQQRIECPLDAHPHHSHSSRPRAEREDVCERSL